MRRALPHIVLCLTLPARADVVTLTDGTKFVGVVTHNAGDGVAIRSGGNDWAFPRKDVAAVKIESAGRTRERRAVAVQVHRSSSPAPSAPSPPSTAPVTDAHVVLYGASWCGACQAAREYFDSRHIPYEDRDIDRDIHARRELAGKCSRAGSPFDGSIPVLDVNGHIIHGFDADSIERALRTRVD